MVPYNLYAYFSIFLKLSLSVQKSHIMYLNHEFDQNYALFSTHSCYFKRFKRRYYFINWYNLNAYYIWKEKRSKNLMQSNNLWLCESASHAPRTIWICLLQMLRLPAWLAKSILSSNKYHIVQVSFISNISSIRKHSPTIFCPHAMQRFAIETTPCQTWAGHNDLCGCSYQMAKRYGLAHAERLMLLLIALPTHCK